MMDFIKWKATPGGFGEHEVREHNALLAERDRYKAALEKLAYLAECDLKMNQDDGPEGGGWWSLATATAIAEAKAALAPTKEPS